MTGSAHTDGDTLPGQRAALTDVAFADEVATLRHDAARRAGSRPTVEFSGQIRDAVCASVPVRWYHPHVTDPSHIVVFLHGGYGLFGDLDLQDAWCRQVADGWGTTLVSVDYPLTPEHTLTESADAVIRVIRAVLADVGADAAGSPITPSLILAGDSAGAALALAVAVTSAAAGGHLLDGLLLTNPNVDLTLRRFVDTAAEGPDRALSERAFSRWTHGWTHSADFVGHAAMLPPTFVAVGSRDALRRQARDLVDALKAARANSQFLEHDAGHGFLSDAAMSGMTIRRSRGFFLD